MSIFSGFIKKFPGRGIFFAKKVPFGIKNCFLHKKFDKTLDFYAKKHTICINFSPNGAKNIITRTKHKRKKMSEFAIFQTGGKQYRVANGDIIKVEKLDATGTVEFDQVLMVGDKIGTPFVEGAKIVAEVVEQKRADKILVFKKKRRQNYRRTAGHRQFITVLKIKEIKA